MKIQAFGTSHVGTRHPRNTDAFLIDHDLGLFALADGIGAESAVDVISFLALETVDNWFRVMAEALPKMLRTKEGNERILHDIRASIQEASRAIHSRALHEPSLRGLYTALTMVLVVGNQAFMGHVGHGRLYLLRKGKLAQISNDHTLVQEMVEQGMLTPEEAHTHEFHASPHRALGIQGTVTVETLQFDVLPGDVLLLCTYSLHHHIKDDELRSVLLQEDVETCPKTLVERGILQREKDDMIAIVAQILGPDESENLPEVSGVHCESLVLEELALLEGHFFAHGLHAREKLQLLHAMEWKDYQVGEIIVPKGEQHQGFMLVASGTLNTLEGPQRKRQRGEGLGARSLLSPYTETQGWQATETCAALCLSHVSFLSLLERHSQVGIKLLQHLGQYLCEKLDFHKII